MIKSVIHIFVHNLPYKVASVLLAVIVWSIVQAEEIVEFNRRVKVNISVANGFAVKGKPYRFVDATLRGPRVLLNELETDFIEAKIFIPSDQIGSVEIPVTKDALPEWDDRIKINLRESYINVFIDEKDAKTLPIREVLQGAPAEGFFIEKIVIKPAQVKVTGLKSDLAKIDEVATEPIDINQLNQSKQFDVKLVTPSSDIINMAIEEVRVNIQLGDSKINKRFTSIPVEIVGSEFKVSARPSLVSIVIQGTPGVLNFVKREDLRAFVEVSAMKPGRYEKDIQVKIPPDTVLIETFPQKVDIEIKTP